MEWILVAVAVIALIFIIRYYSLKNNLNKASAQLLEIRQDLEKNRILRLAAPDRTTEELFRVINEYIQLMRSERITAKNRERDLRNQIENISHDLRTPLTAIIGYLEIVDWDKIDSADREMLTATEQKARFLLTLVNNFYDLSRLELDDYNLYPEQIEVSRFIKEKTLSFYTEFEKRNLTVTFGENFPKAHIIVDKTALERIINNMIQNALRYAQSVMIISLVECDETVQIVFENDTSNLNEQDIEHIFDRFYVKEKSRTGKNSGLGLTVNRLLTEKMGGTVSAKLEGNMLKMIYEFPISKITG